MSRKVIHLENKATGEHKYYGSLVALWKDNKEFPYHTVKRIDLSEGWENETFKVRLGALLTPSNVLKQNETSRIKLQKMNRIIKI